MANPRKFSEKIALHNHRQAEETARFEQIMKEVSDATARANAARSGVASVFTQSQQQLEHTPPPPPQQQQRSGSDSDTGKHTLRLSPQVALGTFRGGSLPNVSKDENGGTIHVAHHPAKPEEMLVHAHSHSNMVQANSPVHTVAPHHNQQYRESRSRSQQHHHGGPIRRPQDRKHDTSPYSSGGSTGPAGLGTAFLSPPPDTSWRRTHSDSALHQSAMQGMSNDHRMDNSNRCWIPNQMMTNGPEQMDGRPRSSCNVPRVPGINIYPSPHEPGTIQIPIGSNTGSLPDLTSVHFPSPIHVPLDSEQDQGSSPYSSSPVNTSPSNLSPTSMPSNVRNQGRFHFNSPVNVHQNHLSVPVNSRYLHHNKGVTVEKSITSLDGVDFTQLGALGYQQQIPPNSPSPTLQQQHVTSTAYRSPQPSPQSSPSLGGRHSAPCSPSVTSPLSPLGTATSTAGPNDYHVLNQHQANQLHHHFEQFTMDWAQLVASLVESGCTWSAQVQGDGPVASMATYSCMDPAPASITAPQMPNNMHHHHHQHHQQQQQQQQQMDNLHHDVRVIAAELGDAGYYSTSPNSQLMYGGPVTAPPPSSLHTTPNTPTSIPDIILTDFSSADDISRQEYKQLEAELLANESSLREGLEPLDFDGLQMLADPGINFIPDSVEELIRSDRS